MRVFTMDMTLDRSSESKCCVCLEEVDYRGTAMIQCARCAISVHVKCYGVSVPSDCSTWHCEACRYMLTPDDRPRMQPYCVVCPVEGGALRQTNQNGVWCHVLCMNWIPELSHSLTGAMDETLDIRTLDKSRETLKCLVCGQRGGCIQCISGRCARAFHVVCAMRCPSDVIFTGYNNENQQVYHCKTHLSDIATFKYEMVDKSWRESPLLDKFRKADPESSGKCRVCQNKVPPINLERHEAQCLVGWLAREELQLRRKKMTELGVTPAVIDYGFGKDKPSTPSKNSKNRKQGPVMRPCPQCGEAVRETHMMGHMRNRCTKSRDANPRAKNPGKMKRKQSKTTMMSSDGADSVQDMSPAQDLSDVLFATWPGQNAGSLLDSSNFWRILGTNFFNSKVLLKKRMEPLCKNLCGAKLEDIGNFTEKRTNHDTLNCADVVLFERVGDTNDKLSLKSVVHRCDFVMRSSRTRCMDDLHAQLLMTIGHREPSEEPESSSSSDGFRVVFQNTSGDVADCRFGLQLRRNGEIVPPVDEAVSEVWSRFHHDNVSTLNGAELETQKLPLKQGDDLWMALRDIDLVDSSKTIDGVEALTADRDEVTPEINLLIDKLREQMHQNRYRMRSLCRKTQMRDQYEDIFQRHKTITEDYYSEFALWKVLCKSLVVGYNEFWRPRIEDVSPTEKASDDDKKSGDDGEEEPVDDGTCVVCFDGQSPESNPIIFCDRCDLAIHQRCYGIQRVPSSNFYCDRCRLEDEGRDPAAEVYCQLCPLRDGAFKRTIDGKWVHVVCALWCPGVWIGDLRNLADIKLVDAAHTTRFIDTVAEVNALIAGSKDQEKTQVQSKPACRIEHGSLCSYCKVTCGRTIRCSHPGCSVSYHPLCGWFEGLPMTVAISENGFVYCGGGAGLTFKMSCADHLPRECTTDMVEAQRKNRCRFRIDSFFVTQSKKEKIGERSITPVADNEPDLLEQWTDRELCSSCFEYPSPTPANLKDFTQLNRRQLMMRCQYCSTYIHPACCLSEIDEVSDLFQSNWICERCTQVGKKASPCVVCDRSADYLMPCVNPTSPGHPTTPPTSNNGIQRNGQATGGTVVDSQVAATSTSARWIHAFCAKMCKVKISRRHHMLCATAPAIANETSGRCDICQQRGRNLASCGSCPKRFHPTCAARKRYFINRSGKTDWKFYCSTHPPSDAAYDELLQSWFTGETLAHLQELRHVLERGRMIIEMARQRDRQKKRMLNLCSLKKMELTMEMILKKRPTATMKDMFATITGEALMDVPKRPPPPKPSKKRARRDEDEDGSESADEEAARETRRTSLRSTETNKRPSEQPVELSTPQKRRRSRTDEDTESVETPTRRSTRRTPGSAAKEEPSVPVAREPRRASRQLTMLDAFSGSEPKGRGRTDQGITKKRLVDALLKTTVEEDFDEYVEEAFPELCEDI
ncbi:hypothetical protein Poli38472_002960 [Pythium oligandrum]|uniref:Uncharacterized protein n=1 Tax=Pythium oligandrum TaxID=41045 RepID=A0A8K1C640_PYTOL|nr:hypothetical protein Poli38472_002960 [Pythium oligandrum]|eukprot:TMW57035.1 hypothetical protein Poli38472_002960 [Pythium oligandrum]